MAPGPQAHTHLTGIYSDESTVSLWYVTVGRTCVERYADVHLAPRTVVVLYYTRCYLENGDPYCSKPLGPIRKIASSPPAPGILAYEQFNSLLLKSSSNS